MCFVYLNLAINKSNIDSSIPLFDSSIQTCSRQSVIREQENNIVSKAYDSHYDIQCTVCNLGGGGGGGVRHWP